MSTHDPDIQRQLADLARRLRAIEDRLGIAPQPADPASPPKTDWPTIALTDARQSPTLPSPTAPIPAAPAAPAKPPPRTLPPPEWMFAPQPAAAASTTAAPSTPSRPHASSPPGPRRDLEQTIGTRLFAAIGAVVVVAGVGLFLKLAYDRGWLDLIPPAGKCLIGAGFGALMLVLGEIARRRINALASAGLSAAGIGALYASAFAAYGVYSLISHPAAFLLLAATSALGIAVAARAHLVSVAIISLIAGYITPLILGDADPHPAVLPTYLISLLAVGLVLSGWRPAPFHLLRPVAWWGTILLGAFWTLAVGTDNPAIAIPFLAAFWSAVHVELSFAARRGGMIPASEPPALETPSPARAPALPRLPAWRTIRPIAGSFSTTAWCALLGAIVLRIGTPLSDWLAPAAAAGATIALGAALAGNLRILRDVPRDDAERLGAALLMQAGALIIAATALAFRGWMEVTAWLAIGVAAIAAARWIGSRGLAIYGLIILVIGTFRLMTMEWWLLAITGPGVHIAGFHLTRWSFLVALAAIAWLTSAALMQRGPDPEAETVVHRPWRSAVNWCIGVGLTLLAMSVLHERTTFEATSTALIALALACAVASYFLLSRGLAGYAIAVLALVGIIALTYAPWTADNVTHFHVIRIAGLILTGWTYVAMLLGLAAIACGRLVLTFDADGRWRTLAGVVAAAGVGSILASVIHLHAAAASVALAWLIISAAAMLAHGALPRLALDLAGLIGLFLTLIPWAKAYIFSPRGPDRWFHSTSPVLLHPGLWTAAAIVLTGAVLVHWWLRRPTTPPSIIPPQFRVTFLGTLVLLALTATSYESARLGSLISADPAARGAAVSIWWGIFALGLLAFGFARRFPLARHIGLGLLLTATAKAVLVDMAGAPQGWRVASFIGLGLFMLGVAVAYSRITARLDTPSPSRPQGAIP